MPSESDLRDLLQGPDPEGRAAIDLDAVLTRARRRRRPRVIAARALGSVALVGVLGTAVVVSLPRAAENTAITAQDTGAGDSDAVPFADEVAGARIVEACGDPFAMYPGEGWELTTSAAAVAADETLVLDLALVAEAPPAAGSLAVRSVALAQDGVIVAYGFPLDAAFSAVRFDGDAPLELEPAFALTTCADGGLAAGRYDVRPVVEFVDDLGDGSGETVVGRPAVLEIG